MHIFEKEEAKIRLNGQWIVTLCLNPLLCMFKCKRVIKTLQSVGY